MSAKEAQVPELMDPEDISDISTNEGKQSLEGKVLLVKWIQPASYAPKASNEKCSICHNHLNEKCAMCIESSQDILSCECKISMGRCGHAFHGHCIEKWTTEVSTCPVEHSPWIVSASDCSQSDWTRLVVQKRVAN